MDLPAGRANTAGRLRSGDALLRPRKIRRSPQRFMYLAAESCPLRDTASESIGSGLEHVAKGVPANAWARARENQAGGQPNSHIGFPGRNRNLQRLQDLRGVPGSTHLSCNRLDQPEYSYRAGFGACLSGYRTQGRMLAKGSTVRLSTRLR